MKGRDAKGMREVKIGDKDYRERETFEAKDNDNELSLIRESRDK